MKEITMQKAISTMSYLMIDMTAPVKGWEECSDFHKGMDCKINGYPFTLYAEGDNYCLAAGAIALTAHTQKTKKVAEFKGGETIAIIALFENGYAKAFETTLPEKIRQQDIILK